jgi:hypothetical protein
MTPTVRDLTIFLRPRRGISRHGLGTVYESLVAIEAAWRLLDRHRMLSIPHDNRRLVEEGTNHDRLSELAEGLGKVWKEHWQNYIGSCIGRAQEASHTALDWFREWNEMSWPPALGERARTRLGLDDRLVTFDHSVCSPFGIDIRDLKIPGWLLRGLQIVGEEQARIIGSDLGIIGFAFGDGRFSYSRLGLEREMD